MLDGWSFCLASHLKSKQVACIRIIVPWSHPSKILMFWIRRRTQHPQPQTRNHMGWFFFVLWTRWKIQHHYGKSCSTCLSHFTTILSFSSFTTLVDTPNLQVFWNSSCPVFFVTGRDHASGIHVDGRIVLNLWRLLRAEVHVLFVLSPTKSLKWISESTIDTQ